MPELPVDASKFAGMSEEQARTFPRRNVVGVELSDAQVSAMPKMISTDAHVMEPDALWQELTPRLRENLPRVPFRNSPPGATDPKLRLRDQDTDGVAAEILFPNYGMALFGIDDIETQQESFKLYNDWMREFCAADPKRLYGAPLVSVYDIKTGQKPGLQGLKDAVNAKTNDSANTLFDFIFSGAFDRHPKMRLLLAESEIGWLPFMLQQWDYYFERFRRDRELPIKRKPSEIFNEHVYGTFLEDYVGTRFFPWWGEKNCMWSNDYTQFNMTIPHSRQVVEYHLSGLSEEKRQRLTRDNAIQLFGLDI